MDWVHWVTALLGIGLLMVVHESGHYFIARAFKMRVERFAIGIGPTIWRHQPKDSDTVFQVGLIPFMAYVQIAGLNPFEENDEDDEGNFVNASLFGRTSTIFAGPLANYLTASLFFFAAIVFQGKPITEIQLPDGEGAAKDAGILNGDKIVEIAGAPIKTWRDIPKHVEPRAGEAITVIVERGGKEVPIQVTPREFRGVGKLGVLPTMVPVPWSEVEWKKAAIASIERPALIVALNLKLMGRMFTGKEKPQLSGPLGLMRETKNASQRSLSDFLDVLGFLSTAVGFFNMLPFPALDGGRLMFLGYEAVTRRRPNQIVEARVHTVGIIVLLTTMVFVTYREWGTSKSPSEQAMEARQAEEAKKAAARKKAEKKKPTKKPDQSKTNPADQAAPAQPAPTE